MEKLILLVSLFLLTANIGFAQQNFLLKDASKTFDVKIKIAKCDTDTCEGRATVYLSRKNQPNVFQTIAMPNMFLELNKERKPTANLIELYGENNSGVVFDDFNFDGVEDLALRNGNDGAYGGPSYDVLLFSKAANKFVKSRELTKLASESLGLFTVDKKKRTIETFNKSGCCYHETTRYKIINNRPQKVYVFTEDATGGDGERVKLTTETLVGGKWKKTVKYARTKDYYKEN
ncbi:MAG: hypothetical protein M3033_00270 [Acidobacteriota bacterium]|nr:hypothetical protein [Acidobacteriota bacterium]